MYSTKRTNFSAKLQIHLNSIFKHVQIRSNRSDFRRCAVTYLAFVGVSTSPDYFLEVEIVYEIYWSFRIQILVFFGHDVVVQFTCIDNWEQQQRVDDVLRFIWSSSVINNNYNILNARTITENVFFFLSFYMH